MAVFLCETGLRIHEAEKRINDPWPVPCPPTMKVRGKGRKDAIIPITQKAREASDRLGGSWPVGARATQRRFERADFTPHQCRHWRATSMVEAGKIGGHEGKARLALPDDGVTNPEDSLAALMAFADALSS